MQRLINLMKNHLIRLLLLITIFTGCKKSDKFPMDNPDLKIAANLSNYYLYQNVSLTATSTESVSTYSWDFGDGTKVTGSNSVQHAYSNGGVYTITLQAGKNKTSKRIRVFPGNASFQIKNYSTHDLTNLSMDLFDPDHKFLTYHLQGIKSEMISDTVFVTVPKDQVMTLFINLSGTVIGYPFKVNAPFAGASTNHHNFINLAYNTMITCDRGATFGDF